MKRLWFKLLIKNELRLEYKDLRSTKKQKKTDLNYWMKRYDAGEIDFECLDKPSALLFYFNIVLYLSISIIIVFYLLFV